MTDELKTYRTAKDNLALYYEGYCFRKSHSLVCGDICWRCSTTGCPASVTTSSKIDSVKSYTNRHKKHAPHQVPSNLSSTPTKGLAPNIGQTARLNRASLDSFLGSLRKPVCFDSESQTDENILKSKDDLLHRIQQLTETQSALVKEIQRLTLELENQKSFSAVTLVDKSVSTEGFSDSCEGCQSIDYSNRKLKEETDSLTKTVKSMSISIETMEADNNALQNEVTVHRNEAHKWRALYDNLCAASNECTGSPIQLHNRFSLLSMDESPATTHNTLVRPQTHKPASSRKPKTQYSRHIRAEKFDRSLEKVTSCIVRDRNTTASCESARYLKRRQNVDGKIKLFSASQGRKLNDLISKRTDARVTSILKPGACFSSVISECDKECRSMSACDLTVLIGGTNDFSRNSHEDYLKTVEIQLQKLTHTSVFLVNVPCRYDLPLSSPTNVAISKANVRLKALVRGFKNVELFDVHGLGRRFYTRHGLHINLIGKCIIADRILQSFQSVRVEEAHCNITITTPDPASSPSPCHPTPDYESEQQIQNSVKSCEDSVVESLSSSTVDINFLDVNRIQSIII